MVNKEKLKEKYMEYQLLMEQLQQLQENVSTLEKHTMELVFLTENLDSVSKTKIGQETLVPLGSGIFLKGSLKENSNVIMSVGSSVCIEKDIAEAKKTVSEQLGEVNQVLTQMQEEVGKTTFRLQELQNEFQGLKADSLN